jgi:hypothetical protein
MSHAGAGMTLAMHGPMSTQLQSRARRLTEDLPDESVRFESMVVPIDRSRREPAEAVESLPPAPVVLLNFGAAVEPKRVGWLPVAACVVTGLLLIPILCLALFPVSVLAVFLTPFAGAVYAATFATRQPSANPQRGKTSLGLSDAA